MSKEICRLLTTTSGIEDVQVNFAGTTLILNIFYEYQGTIRKTTVKFIGVLAYRIVTEPAAFCEEHAYDSIIIDNGDRWLREIVSAVNPDILLDSPNIYKIFLSNFGSTHVIAASFSLDHMDDQKVPE